MSKKKTVFVVHGRNEKIRESTFVFLQSIGLEPLEWSEIISKTKKASPYIGEVLEKGFPPTRDFMCYQITGAPPVGKEVQVFNQFEDGTFLQVQSRQLLCVPTEKVEGPGEPGDECAQKDLSCEPRPCVTSDGRPGTCGKAFVPGGCACGPNIRNFK